MSNFSVVEGNESSRDIIEKLNDLLNMAKEGLFRSLYVVGVTKDDAVFSRSGGHTLNLLEMVGTFELLKHDYLDATYQPENS